MNNEGKDTQRRNRNKPLLVALLGLLSLLCIASAVSADVWDQWDYPGQKRKLKVWVRGAGGIPGFAAAVQAAMDDWNGSSGDPPKKNNGSWNLVPGTEGDHDVAVSGGKGDGRGGNLGKTSVSVNGDGEAVGDVKVKMDSDENWGPGADQHDLERAIKHELGHCQRMDDTDIDGDIMNRYEGAGDHNVTPSGHDQSEARAAFWDNMLIAVTPDSVRTGVPTVCDFTGPMNLGNAASVAVQALDPTHLQIISQGWNPSQVEIQAMAAPDLPVTVGTGAWHNEGFTINITYRDASTATFGSFVTTNPVDPPQGQFPHAVAGPDVVIPAGKTFVLPHILDVGGGSFHDDPTYTPSLTHVWSWNGGPGLTTMAQTEILPMTINTPGTYTFTLEVEDLFGQKSSDTVSVEVDAVPPVNTSISPCAGTPGTSPITLTSVYSDANGYTDIRYCYLLVNDSLAQTNAVVLLYDRLANKVYMKNDAGTSWSTGYAPGTAITLENSQCMLHVADTSVSGSGNDLTVNWKIHLKSPFSAKLLNAYMYVRDNGGLTDGWDRMGIYYNIKPQVVDIWPSGDPLLTGFESNLLSRYRDLNGFADLRKCYVLVNDSLTFTNAMFLWYDQATNKVYLKNDANTSWGTGYAPGTAVTLSNSQCDVNVGAISVTPAGTDLSVLWTFTLKSPMEGKNLCSWMYVTDSAGEHDGWKKVGTHFVPVAPTCLFLSPTTGTVPTGSPWSYATIYSDDNGFGDIYKIYIQLSVTSSQANAVLLMWDAKLGKVFLRNDANTSWGTGGVPGSATILENGQCTVDLSTMGAPNGVTTEQLEVFWPVTLKGSQAGKKLQERMYVIDNELMISGWKFKGVVTAL